MSTNRQMPHDEAVKRLRELEHKRDTGWLDEQERVEVRLLKQVLELDALEAEHRKLRDHADR